MKFAFNNESLMKRHLTLWLWGTQLLSMILLSSSAPVEDFHSIVEKAASSVSNDLLKDDQLVTLEVTQDHSIYRHTKTEKHGAPIYIRKGSDLGKSVVVLKAGEDFLPQCKEKRTFVVLKQVGPNKNEYRVFFAYVKQDPLKDSAAPPIIEWDSWSPRGNSRNKALSFGFTKCTRSNMVPCKKDLQTVSDDSPDFENFPGGNPPLPYHHPPPKVIEKGGFDYWCDLHESSDLEKRFVGSVVGALTQGMVVLTGAELVYSNEEMTVAEVKQEIKSITNRGRAMGTPSSNASVVNQAAEKLVNRGRETVAGGTLLFYAAIVKIGAFAIGELPPNERPPESITEAQFEELSKRYKDIGLNILRDLFRGVDFDDPEQKHEAQPNPTKLMNENVVGSLVSGLKVGEKGAVSESDPTGRGILGWLTGKADVGTSSSNGEQIMRQYKGVQKDGSVTGSKGIDSLNFAIDNAFGGTKKSAGQVFSENIVAGVYLPLGIIEDAGDALGGSVFGIGKLSDDRTYVDDLVDKAMNVVGGAAGQIVDAVGDIFGPIGLGGLWTGIAGVAATTLGAIGGGIAAPVLGIYTLVKMGAKALGIGGVIGMQGDKSRQANEGQNQNTNRYSAPQDGPPGAGQAPIQMTAGGYGATFGRKKRQLAVSNWNVQAVTDIDLFSQLGWTTVQTRQEHLANTTFPEEVPFIGFGNCVHKHITTAEMESIKNGKEAAHRFFQTLRTHCLKDQLEAFHGVVSDGFLKFNEQEKAYDIPAGLPSLTKAKLSIGEINSLSKAFEMSAYSKTYMKSLKKDKPKQGSRNAATLTSMVLYYLEEAGKIAPLHYVKLTRRMGALVKTAFTKVLQDFIRFKHCRKCNKEQMKSTLQDCVIYATLLEFVLKDQQMPNFIKMPKEQAFDKFFKESSGQKLELYFV